MDAGPRWSSSPGFLAACVVLLLLGVGIGALVWVVRRTWQPDISAGGFLRVSMSGGMTGAKLVLLVLSLLSIGALVGMACNVLDGSFSVVVGVLITAVCCLVAAVVLWMSWPRATIELDAKSGELRLVRWQSPLCCTRLTFVCNRYTRYHHLVSPEITWQRSLHSIVRFDTVTYAVPAGLFSCSQHTATLC